MTFWRTIGLRSLVIGALLVCAFAQAGTARAQETIASQYQDIRNQGIIFAGICTSANAACECRDQGNCSLEDILQVVVNIGTFILGISGSVLLVLMLYGGVQWLTSAGNPERINAGKQTMVGAVIGIIIVFGAYTAVTVLISVLKTGEIPNENLEDVIGSVGGVCSQETPDGTLWPCSTDADCLDWLSYNIDLGVCLIPEGAEVIETQ